MGTLLLLSKVMRSAPQLWLADLPLAEKALTDVPCPRSQHRLAVIGFSGGDRNKQRTVIWSVDSAHHTDKTVWDSIKVIDTQVIFFYVIPARKWFATRKRNGREDGVMEVVLFMLLFILQLLLLLFRTCEYSEIVEILFLVRKWYSWELVIVKKVL